MPNPADLSAYLVYVFLLLLLLTRAPELVLRTQDPEILRVRYWSLLAAFVLFCAVACGTTYVAAKHSFERGVESARQK